MGTCFSKKNGASTSPNKSVSQHRNSENNVTVTLSKPPEPDVSLKKKQEPESAPQYEGEVKKEIFIIKHRKSHDDRERTTTTTTASKTPSCIAQPPPAQQADGVFTNEEPTGNKVVPSTPNTGVGVRTSSCTKEEVDAILIQCGRLSRSSSGRKYSGSKRSFDFDHCDNDTTSAEDDQRKAKGNGREENDGVAASESCHHRQSPRRSQGRRRTPSREREQSSGRERRVSRSPGRRSSDSTANASNNNASSRPGKMVSVPATVSSLVMDKSNNCGGESGTKRTTVKRNVGDVGSRSAASPRAQSPARVNGNVASAKVLGENQQHQQPSLSRNNSSRKAEQSPYRRNPLSEVDTNSKVQQNKPKIEAEAIQKPNGRVALEKKGVGVNCKTKEQHEEESSVPDSAVVKTTVVSSGVDNLKPQGLTRSRSSRRSRDLDINPEAVVNPTHSYASLLLEDIQNFHQKNTPPPPPPQQQQPSISLPACLTKACSILEAVADLNSTTSSNFSGACSEDRRSPSTQQSIRSEYNAQLGSNHYGKRMPQPGAKDPFVESEVAVSDDVMEPSLHKYVTVKRGGGVDMEDQESSGSNSFTVTSSGQHHWGTSCSSWEPNSADSTDCCTSRLSSREEGQKSTLALENSLSSEAKKCLNSKRRECDHEHSSGIGRGRLGSNKGLNTLPVVTAAATT
ncbi:hypothetical protein E2542_SST21079 [Spatholobus suberectus]|nr:hypothetical protein E2542_SST21079 [Spatholobus suberectus]